MPPTAGGAIAFVAIAAAGLVLTLFYVAAPFVLYGIYSRLGRLIELQEYALTRHLPTVQPTPEQRASELTAARAQWSKL